MDIILASGSPRRKELLAALGLRDFQILIPDFDEGGAGPLPPGELVACLSRGKARAASSMTGGENLIIAADTVVALDGDVLGKPKDEADARTMLARLSGRAHLVYTGVTVLCGEQEDTRTVSTEVTFRPLCAEEIAAYVRTGEPMDKAGAYGIQGLGAQLVTGIRGDYFNVMGLPLCTLAGMLRDFGVDPLALAAGKEAGA